MSIHCSPLKPVRINNDRSDSYSSNPKSSCYISHDEAVRFREAALFAYCSGRPLNEFVTIHYDKAEVSDRGQFRALLCKLLGNWLSRRCGFPACYVWVMENPPRWLNGRGGLHLHLVAHVPRGIRPQFRTRLKKWIEQAGGKMKPGALKRKAVRHSGPEADPEMYLKHGIWGLVRYLLKGMSDEIAAMPEITRENQGVVIGKRIGYSEALGEQHRWHPVAVSSRPGLFIAGQDSRRRHWVRLVCPELLGLEG